MHHDVLHVVHVWRVLMDGVAAAGNEPGPQTSGPPALNPLWEAPLVGHGRRLGRRGQASTYVHTLYMNGYTNHLTLPQVVFAWKSLFSDTVIVPHSPLPALCYSFR